MKNRVIALRVAAVAACLLTLAAACTSSHNASKPGSASMTTDPNETPNSIPFEVGARVGLPGWIVQIVKVHRPYTNPTLPELAADRRYIALDISLQNVGTSSHDVKAADVFSLGDSTGKVDAVVAVPGQSNGLDGSYAPQKVRTGQVVFDVPRAALLRMALDGPLIGTQKAIFNVVPPTVAPDQS